MRRGPGCGTGCLVGPIAFIMVMIFIILTLSNIFAFRLPSFMAASSGNITTSTVKRVPLPVGAVNETDYCVDKLNWIGNRTTLEAGMKNFYIKTGVQPFLYITDEIDGNNFPTESQFEEFAYKTYDSLISDEAHLLLIFFEYDEKYQTWYLAGTQAKTVLDKQAMDILLDYVDRYYYDQNLTDEQMFSKAFNDAGDRIMKVEKSPWIPVLIVFGALAIVAVSFLWWKYNKKQKNLEAEQTQKILDTPLETFGGSEAETRAKKYET